MKLSVFLVALLSLASVGIADMDTVEQVRERVARDLLTKDVGEWAARLGKLPSSTEPPEILLRVLVLARAGHLEALGKLVDGLAEPLAAIDQWDGEAVVRAIVDCDDYALSRRLFERGAHPFASTGDHFVEQWERDGDPKELEPWLEARAAPDSGWWYHSCRLRKKKGTAGEIVDRAEADMRDRPDDFEAIRFYLFLADRIDREPDVEWILANCRPKSPFGSFRMAKLIISEDRRAAIGYLLRSLEQEYTEADVEGMYRWMRSRCSGPVERKKDWEEILRDETKYALMKIWLKVGEPKQAQPLLEELSAKHPDGLPRSGFGVFAGQTQAGSGARVIEQRIRDAEAENTDSAAYWLKRAHYFRGRGENDEAERAYAKSLELSKSGKHVLAHDHSKGHVLTSYAYFLKKTKGEQAALDLLRREFEHAEKGGEYANWILWRSLGGWIAKGEFAQADDPLIWAHLAKRDRWCTEVEDILKWLAGHVADPDALWDRLERLAAEGDSSRRWTLAQAMLASEAKARAIPLMKRSSADGSPNRKAHARKEMFETYLEIGKWATAEALWRKFREDFYPTDWGSCIRRMATCAAKAGAKDRALGLWVEGANFDRLSGDGLDRMLDAGMREKLLGFYREMKKKDPASAAPDRFIAKISASERGPGAR
jgi:tetratricopeptide (TPR) repeat protein